MYSGNDDHNERGRRVVLCIGIVLLAVFPAPIACSILFGSGNLLRQVPGIVVPLGGLFILVCGLFYFLVKGASGARWAIVVLCLPIGVASIVLSTVTIAELGEWGGGGSLIGLGSVLAASTVILLTAPSVRRYFRQASSSSVEVGSGWILVTMVLWLISSYCAYYMIMHAWLLRLFGK